MKSAKGLMLYLIGGGALALLGSRGFSQMIDNTQAHNSSQAGINKSLAEEIGAGRGDLYTPNSSGYIINRDPFRAIRRGRQLFQRKFTRAQGQGPGIGDGTGDLNTTIGIGAGLVDSCGGCHARPRGSAGFGGDVVTRPDSRSAPHLFGLGLKEMLADEITSDLRRIRTNAGLAARLRQQRVTLPLVSKGIHFGSITAAPDGSLDTSQVEGVDPDLRVRPFFAQGGTISIREFVVGALHAEMGLESVDPDLERAHQGGRVLTLSGMVLDGSADQIEGPPTPDPNGGSEIPAAVIDYLEFYLLNYFKPGSYQQTDSTDEGRRLFRRIGCESCHVGDLQIDHDRRVADVETVYDPTNGILNNLFAMATPLFHTVDDGRGPSLKQPNSQPFLVRNIFTDLKRHDLGTNFYERNWDKTQPLQKQFLTKPLWGVGSTAPYGHDGRSISLTEVILRHGGEAQQARDAFADLQRDERQHLLDFLSSLVLFPPDDTASNLDPGNRSADDFPQFGHGSIRLTALFNDPRDLE